VDAHGGEVMVDRIEWRLPDEPLRVLLADVELGQEERTVALPGGRAFTFAARNGGQVIRQQCYMTP
jgi:hypothetical protein